MRKRCLICDRDFKNILTHISVRHGISSIEEYNLRIKEREDKKIKIQEFLGYTEELMRKFRKNEISGEELRFLREKWEKDNNLKW